MGIVVKQAELASRRAGWKRDGKTVVFVQGHFELLHPGYVRLLEHARSLGDVLVVAVEGDVAAAAGSKRGGAAQGVTPAAERAEILAALAAVDFVLEPGAARADAIPAWLEPEIIVKGGAEPGIASPHVAEASASASAHSKIVWVPLEPGYSTAGLIERIRQLPT